MLISQLYNEGVIRLNGAGIDDAELEASLLLSFILQKTRTSLYLSSSEVVSVSNYGRFKKVLDEREKGIPLAYITGEQEFWSLLFAVSPAVLIPRPETELIIDLVLSTEIDRGAANRKIVDLGTGSGILAVVLAKELPGAKVVAVDRSLAALKIAQRNIGRHGLTQRVFPVCSDWGKALQGNKWDIVVSNPPYIAQDRLNNLQPEVKKEPMTALDGGVDGMDAIAVLAPQLSGMMQPGGWFFMEIGFDQEEKVLQLFNTLELFDNVVVHKDHAGLPRVLQARKRE